MARPMDTNEYDWQSRKSIIECNRHMLTNQLLCDVTFRVGPVKEIVPAHKYVLASRSCVFYAMFKDANRGQSHVIDIPDIGPEIFKAVLQFLYYDEIKIDLDNVTALLYISQKYSIQQLVEKCLKRLRSRMDPANICTIMETAHTYDDTRLRQDCLQMILRKPMEVFESEVFSELCTECLGTILSEDKLPLGEEKIFEAAMLYAEQKCRDKIIDVTPKNRRYILGKALTHIRFPLMDQEYFSNKVEPMGILTDKECVEVMRYFMKRENGCETFSTTPRCQLKSIFRFHDLASGWNYQRNKQDSVIFTPSANILVYGLVVYGSCDTSAEYEINMALKQVPYYGVVASKPGIILKTDGAQKLYNVLFDMPVEVKKDKDYSVSVVFKEGAASSFKGINGLPETEQDGIRFTFKKCQKSTNNTSVDTGQIPGILYETLGD